MDTFHLYQDIQARTKGEIYIGVVGPAVSYTHLTLPTNREV